MRRGTDEAIHPHVRGVRASATVAINEHSNALIAEGRTIYKLGLGQSPFPVPEHIVQALRDHAAEKAYLPVRGLHALRRAVAHYAERKAGIDRTADDVLIGPGSKELMFLLQLVFEGELLIPTPAWASYRPQAQIIGREVRLLETRREDGWMLSAEGLEAALADGPDRPRVLVLNYPNNPTGSTLRPEQLKAIARVAERHGALILSDEIYGELHHRGEHQSIGRYYPDGTILSAGISKWCGAGGWRLGAFVFPERLRWLLDTMAAVASETYTSVSAPIQHAAVVAFEGGDVLERYLANARRILSALGRWCARELRDAGADCPQPTGGFYLFPDFSKHADRLRADGIETSSQLCVRLLDEAGVATLPGASFGRPEHELTLRLAYVDFDGTRALEAVSVIPKEQPLDATFLKRHCRRVVEAVEATRRFLERRTG